MLQQVLRDMYIDPELLAGLAEKDKQTLYCCMRGEQIRRWRLWDQKESEAMKNQHTRSKRKGKSVQWALDSTGEPRVDIIDCEYLYDETDYPEKETKDLNKEYEQKELRLSVKDGQSVDLKNNETAVNKIPIPKYVDVSVTNKTTSSASIVINFNEKRGALTELSLNKVPKVARQVAEWEKRVTKDGEPKTPSPVKNTAIKSTKDIEDTANETEQEQLWREQQKKAKEAEIRMRTIARLAREEHRRSMIENGDENFQSLLIQDNAFELCKNVSKPPSKEALLEWFRSTEIPKKAVLEKDNSTAKWFHGFISWREAESILNEEKCGTFLVRICERVWGYAISYKDTVGVKHYLIDASNGHYKILGTDHISHNTLGDLISFYKIKPLTSNTEETLKYPCLRSRDLSAVM